MIKKQFFYNVLLALLIKGSLFAQIVELPFSEKIKNATTIFEGKVTGKASFWNDKHTLIFTANTVEVYKVFKGNLTAKEVQIIVEGGTVGNDMQRSESTINFKEGFVGVFLAESTNTQSSENKSPAFKLYGSSQGFIKYDLVEKTASDPFKKYANIQDDLYKAINTQTGEQIREIKSFNIDKPNETGVKKESFCERHCKKRKKRKENKLKKT
jgi:hypothetical protein